MRDQYFDEQIKTKLQQLAVPYREADWEQFQKQLEPPIDYLARTKLVVLEEQASTPDWEQFYDKFTQETFSKISDYSLNTQPTTAFDTYIPDDFDLKLEKSLDTPVKDALEDYEASYEFEEDWEAFSAQFHGSFDASIQHQLRNYEAVYNPGHWQAMTEQLNQPFYISIKSKIANYQVPFKKTDWWRMTLRLSHRKLVESEALHRIPRLAYGMAAVIALLLMLNLLPRLHRSSVYQQPMIANNSVAEQELRINEPENSTIPIIDPSQISRANELQKMSSTNIIDQIANLGKNLASQEVSVSPNSSVISTFDSPYVTEKIAVTPEAPETSLLPFSDELIPEKQIDRKEELSGASYSFAGINPIPTDLSSGFLNIGGTIPDIGDEQITKLNSPSGHLDPEIKIGILGGFNSSVAELSNEGKGGYHVGIRLQMAFDESWSVVSGISYAEKHYQHLYIDYETNQNPQRYVEADFKTVEIPLLVRHTFPKTGKANLYVQAGIIAMISMEEAYSIFNPSSVANIGTPEPSLRKLDPQNQLLNFHTYIGNAHAAMGLEYDLGDHIQLQLEPFFQLGFQKMGFPAKKLYSAGINIGAVYRLGKKGT